MGFDGNDILVAQSGKLDGGKGRDVYRVLQNTRDENVIFIIEEDNLEELSTVFLDYSVTQIISIKKIKQHVFIELRNNNQSITTLALFYVYPSKPQRSNLAPQYTFYTYDGMIFSGLLPEIVLDPHKEDPEPLTLIARYTPNFDKNFLFPESDNKETPLIIQKMPSQKSPGAITVRGEEKILPECLTLIPEETGFNDDLQGDDLSNTFQSKTGEDILEGKGGRDVYIIEDRPMGTEVGIHNYDKPEKGSPEQDIVLLPFALEDIQITQEDDDLILSHIHSSVEHVNLRLINFMIDENYRHLSIMDKEGHLHTLGVNSNNEPHLIIDQLFPNTTVNDHDDHLSQLRQNSATFSEAQQILNLPKDKIWETLIPIISS